MKKMLNLKKRLIVFLIMLFSVVSLLNIQSSLQFPSEINLYKGEQLLIGTSSPYSLSMPAVHGGVLSENGNIEKDAFSSEERYVEVNETGNFSASVKLFGVIPVRDVDVNVLNTKKLLPGGEVIGIKMFTEGLLCVGISDVADINGNIINIAHENDIKVGDIIVSAYGKKLLTTEKFAEIIENSNGEEIQIEIIRNNEKISKNVKAVKTPEGYKIGLWLRDSTAGIGTLSFIDESNRNYGALGHPICDSDTGIVLPVSDGEVIKAEVFDIEKGKNGVPGELKGSFPIESKEFGTIEKNTNSGIYGIINSDYSELDDAVPVASKNAIEKGKAHILCDVDGNGKQSYEIEIQKIYKNSTEENKNMVIKITDKELLEKAGGIVQGMSGSPILQNGRIVGAVTHVFVNDPTRGYGIFIENMLSEAEKTK